MINYYHKNLSFPWNVRYFFRFLPREIRGAWQRYRRGWCDEDCWNVDYYIATVLPEMIRYTAKNSTGCPAKYFDASEKGDECWLYREVLESIAYKIEAMKYVVENTYPPAEEEIFLKKYQEGMKELGELGELWN